MNYTWADVEAYDDMIDSLAQFCESVEAGSQTMVQAGQTCVDALQEDLSSLKAYKRILTCVKQYQDAVERAKALGNALIQEREAIVEYLRITEGLDEE